MTRWMKDFMKNKRKAAVSLLAVVLVGVMGISLFNNQTINTYALETTVETDASTQDSWTDYKKDSTHLHNIQDESGQINLYLKMM